MMDDFFFRQAYPNEPEITAAERERWDVEIGTSAYLKALEAEGDDVGRITADLDSAMTVCEEAGWRTRDEDPNWERNLALHNYLASALEAWEDAHPDEPLTKLVDEGRADEHVIELQIPTELVERWYVVSQLALRCF